MADVCYDLNESLLNSYLDLHIGDVCLNAYKDDSDNHCAHFVNHAMQMTFGYTCDKIVPAKQRIAVGSNVRVHETFDQCPSKEKIETTASKTGLCFVSLAGNFVKVGSTYQLANVPKKHIGVMVGNNVWHYSNSKHKVVKQTLAEFILHYSGQTNALWWGQLPAMAMPTPWTNVCEE
jgi:hypothetical protein